VSTSGEAVTGHKNVENAAKYINELSVFIFSVVWVPWHESKLKRLWSLELVVRIRSSSLEPCLKYAASDIVRVFRDSRKVWTEESIDMFCFVVGNIENVVNRIRDMV
jgi:hypothetical protein